MRKRLIGKAFAIAMSGAMVLTATPVTANIFNVAHIVKAAEKAQNLGKKEEVAEEETPAPTQEELLAEIRDLLANK